MIGARGRRGSSALRQANSRQGSDDHSRRHSVSVHPGSRREMSFTASIFRKRLLPERASVHIVKCDHERLISTRATLLADGFQGIVCVWDKVDAWANWE